SIGRALGYGADGALEELRQQARELLAAALANDEAAPLQAAHRPSTAGARAALSDVLDQLARWIQALAAAASGAADLVINVDAIDWLRANADPGIVGNRAAEAIAAVETAMDLAQGNVNPQLVLADLLRTLRLLRPVATRS